MNIVSANPMEDEDTTFLDGKRGSVTLASQPFATDVHRVDGRSLDLQTLLLAKQEFLDHMRSILMKGIKEGLVSQHETAVSQSPSYAAEIDTYQRVLRQTKLWNQDIIVRETDRVLGDNKSLFPNLLAALYISQVKLMASVRVTKGPCTVQINVPSSESFIHRVYVECARILFSNPLLIYVGRNMSPQKICERNTNLSKVVNDGVLEAVRFMLPVKDIMSEYLNCSNLHSSVLSMGDDFEAYMKSPYESRYIEAPPAQIPMADPFQGLSSRMPRTAAPLPLPLPLPRPAVPDLAQFSVPIGIDNGFAPEPETKTVNLGSKYDASGVNLGSKFDSSGYKAPDHRVSKFDSVSDDGSGSEIPESDESDSDVASSRDFEEDS